MPEKFPRYGKIKFNQAAVHAASRACQAKVPFHKGEWMCRCGLIIRKMKKERTRTAITPSYLLCLFLCLLVSWQNQGMMGLSIEHTAIAEVHNHACQCVQHLREQHKRRVSASSSLGLCPSWRRSVQQCHGHLVDTDQLECSASLGTSCNVQTSVAHRTGSSPDCSRRAISRCRLCRPQQRLPARSASSPGVADGQLTATGHEAPLSLESARVSRPEMFQTQNLCAQPAHAERKL